MDVKDFYFDLPQELIAQDPLEDRSSSRLLVLDKKTGKTQHRIFKDIVEYLRPGDCLVINDTKVIPARLFGVKKDTGAKIEVLLLKRRENDIWETLVKPGKKAKPGTVIDFGDGILTGTVIETVDDGNRLIQFSYEGIFEEILDRLGQMPLPPYITHQLKDKNRYQTVYAKELGSAAAPTAGLHFTPELMDTIRAKGVNIAEVTLHVGLGTFRPVQEDEISDHKMHSEWYCIDEKTAQVIEQKDEKNIPNEEDVKMKKVLKIEGMMCSHCTGRVDKALNDMDGVKATVSLEGKSAEVELTKDISDEALVKAVTDAGYEVVDIQ